MLGTKFPGLSWMRINEPIDQPNEEPNETDIDTETNNIISSISIEKSKNSNRPS